VAPDGYDPLEVDALTAEAAAIVDELAQSAEGSETRPNASVNGRVERLRELSRQPFSRAGIV
jgi:hypothetical protein